MRRKTTVIRVGALVLFALWCVAQASEASADDQSPTNHRGEIEAWIEGRLTRLTKPDGYLSIVGLYPLEEGANSFGADSSNDLVFPSGAPKRIGTLDLRKGVVTVTIEPSVPVMSDSARVTTLVLRDDGDGEQGPTLLEMGTLSWYMIKRGDQRLLRLKDSKSPLIRNFRGIGRYPIDERWQFVARLERYDPDKYISITNTIGVTVNQRVFGAIVFDIGGQTYRLDALDEIAQTKQMFVIFADETSGVETYGGGRFIYVDPPGQDGTVVLDFNKAYNPPCVFNKYTTCPLPPPQNVLPIAVTAGEKTYQIEGE
jgi:hypothetical protein